MRALSRPAPERSRPDRGSTTAETAVVLPVLVVVLLAAVWVLACLAAQLRCVDAARAAARAAARGDVPATVTASGRELAPAGARVLVRTVGETVEVEVVATVQPLGGVLGRLGAVDVRGHAAAVVERPAR